MKIEFKNYWKSKSYFWLFSFMCGFLRKNPHKDVIGYNVSSGRRYIYFFIVLFGFEIKIRI